MNFCGFSFDSETRGQVSRLAQSGRLPHAVIIESKSEEQAKNLAALLSAYAVCESEDKPCGVCRQCKNALSNAHPDIKKLEPDKKSKSGIYSIEQIRDLAVDAQVRPNDADAKVYIFEEADKRFPEVQQNAFLKLLEEPPQRIYFLLLVKSAKALLPTIRSRCTVIRTGGEEAISGEDAQSAKEIIPGILSPREYEANSDKKLARKLASKLTRKKIIEMIELTDSCDYKLRQNSNINLLTTWLCGEYRRILWQR